MTTTDRSDHTKGLRRLADLVDAHLHLPLPYITVYSSDSRTEAAWYLHINDLEKDLAGQKAIAASIIRTLGGQWDKKDRSYDTALEFNQVRDGISLQVVVARAAVCERVVVGTHEVTTPAMPAMPARPAEPGHTTTVEDIKWVCSSLLADVDQVLPV